jgi:hypothetical protein
MSALSSFHLFPKLPSELRIKVWNLALSFPRVVTVSCLREREQSDSTRRFTKAFVSRTPVPALLHTCRESRLEGFLTYEPMFKSDRSPSYTYVSIEHDTIHAEDSMLVFMGKVEGARLQRMIIDVKEAAYFGHFYMDVLMRMAKLKELELRVVEEKIPWMEDRNFVDGLIGDFEQARVNTPMWVCPRVRILNKNTGEELTVIPGGTAPRELIEDWEMNPK